MRLAQRCPCAVTQVTVLRRLAYFEGLPARMSIVAANIEGPSLLEGVLQYDIFQGWLTTYQQAQE